MFHVLNTNTNTNSILYYFLIEVYILNIIYLGCTYKMSQNNSNLELVTFQIDNPVIKPDLIVLEAHPFPVVHRVNGTLCYFKCIGNKFLV